jgi:hypothetical protein
VAWCSRSASEPTLSAEEESEATLAAEPPQKQEKKERPSQNA